MNIDPEKLKIIYNKIKNGDRLTDKELNDSIDVFKVLVDISQSFGDDFYLTFYYSKMKLLQLEDMKTFRISECKK